MWDTILALDRVYGGKMPALNLIVYFSIDNCVGKIEKKHSVEKCYKVHLKYINIEFRQSIFLNQIDLWNNDVLIKRIQFTDWPDLLSSPHDQPKDQKTAIYGWS